MTDETTWLVFMIVVIFIQLLREHAFRKASGREILRHMQDAEDWRRAAIDAEVWRIRVRGGTIGTVHVDHLDNERADRFRQSARYLAPETVRDLCGLDEREFNHFRQARKDLKS